MIHCYKLHGYNIVLDVASGSIHSVDDVAYDLIHACEGLDDCDIEGNQRVLVQQVLSKYDTLTEADILELISDVETLKSQGKLFSSDTYANIAAINNKYELTALCMNVSHVCNMSCAYCFAGKGEYGNGDDGKRSSNNEASSTSLMNLETAKRAIDFLIEQSGNKSNLDVDFFGGEPLLNWQLVKDTIMYARSIEDKCNKKFRFTLTTNGLLIDDDVIDFACKEIYNVVLSLDGRPEVNDAMRKTPSGGGTYFEVVDKFEEIVEARQGKGYYIRGTFTNKNMDFVNDILHIANLGYKELSMEPVVTKDDDPLGFTMDDLPELYRQYEELAVEMLKREKNGEGFSFYHYTIDLSGGPCVHKRIAGCGVGIEYLAVTPSGELYPCHQFVGDTNFLMGNVWSGVTNNELRDGFATCSIYTREECRDCWARFYCSGGCAANAYNDSGSINGINKLGCELFKKRIECAIMMNVARQISA
ncbi:MAG: thioether cross-link-forming SCIFF peptide maturase [Oscillospiraceae bacterium]|nr:thioether cross-link-forming SCIFF peptide maturase [Oscillospiraceae bacterium]